MRMKIIFAGFLIATFLSFGCAVSAIAQDFEGSGRMKSSVEETWQQNVNELRLYVNSLLELNGQLKAERDDLEQQAGELEKSLSELRDSNQSLDKDIAALKQERSSSEKQLDALKRAKTASCPEDKSKKSEKLLKECSQQRDKLSDSVRLNEAEIKKLQKEISKYKKTPEAKCPPLDKEALGLKRDVSQLQSENAQLNERLAGVSNDLNLRLKEIEILRNENRHAVREKEIADSLLKIQRLPPVELTAMEGATKVKINHELVGYNLAKAGKYSQAIEEYQLALQENPASKDIYFNLGVVYSKTKDYLRAADNYQKVLALDSADKEALLNLSRIYERLNDPAKSKYYHDLYLKLKQGKR